MDVVINNNDKNIFEYIFFELYFFIIYFYICKTIFKFQKTTYVFGLNKSE